MPNKFHRILCRIRRMIKARSRSSMNWMKKNENKQNWKHEIEWTNEMIWRKTKSLEFTCFCCFGMKESPTNCAVVRWFTASASAALSLTRVRFRARLPRSIRDSYTRSFPRRSLRSLTLSYRFTLAFIHCRSNFLFIFQVLTKFFPFAESIPVVCDSVLFRRVPNAVATDFRLRFPFINFLLSQNIEWIDLSPCC